MLILEDICVVEIYRGRNHLLAYNIIKINKLQVEQFQTISKIEVDVYLEH